MLRLFTGLPGSAKTQLMIKRAIEDGRPVYYCNIPLTPKGLQLGWVEFDFKNWQQVPSGSLILVDEVQHFIPATNRESVDWVRLLSDHRHNGVDIWMATQHPKQMSAYVRRLVGEWLELIRVFGRNVSTINTRIKVEDNEPIVATEIFAFDKKIWELYESATVHTKHGRVPFKLIAGVIVVVVGLIFVVWKWNTTGAGALDGSASKKAMEKITGSPLAVTVSVPPVPPISSVAQAPACAVLTGIVRGADRALLVFEYPDGTAFREAIHPSTLDREEIAVRGCAYFLGAGSMLTRDAVSREALQAKKARDIAPLIAVASPVASVPGGMSLPSDVVVGAVKSKNSEAFRRAIGSAAAVPASLRPVHESRLIPVPAQLVPLK